MYRNFLKTEVFIITKLIIIIQFTTHKLIFDI